MHTIPFLDLKKTHSPIRKQLDEAYARVMNSGHFIMGSELEAFEIEFATYSEVKYCVGVGNGLDALHLSLLAYGVGSNDEVIVPSNTFIATWLAVSQVGATPIAVEPNPLTFNIDPDRIESAITSKTKAIIPVHLYGQTAEMNAINEIAKRHDLVVIEDAAQAQGAQYHGRKACSLGHIAATSFYPGKSLGALGDGGAILTSDEKIANKIRLLRNYGSNKKYEHFTKGVNSRLDELQAAFLRVKLSYLDRWNEHRRKIANIYLEGLIGSDLILPFVPKHMNPVWHLFVIKSPKRDQLISFLNKHGVEVGIHYPIPPYDQPCYAAEFGKSLNRPYRDVSSTLISLPISPAIDFFEAEKIVKIINGFH